MSNKSSAAGLFGQDGSDLFEQFSGPSLFTLAAPAPVPAVVAPAPAAPVLAPTPAAPAVAPAAPAPLVTPTPPLQQYVQTSNQTLPGQQSHTSLPNMYSRGGHVAAPPPLTSSSSHLNLSHQQQPPTPTYNPRVPISHPQPPEQLSSPPPPPYPTPSQPSVSLPSHHQAVSPQRPTQVVQPIQQHQQPPQQPGEASTGSEPPAPMPSPSLPPPPQSVPNVPTDTPGRMNPAAAMPLPVPPCKPHWYYLEDQKKWTPFSHFDSNRVETLFRTRTPTGTKVVSTEGGRYDVNLERWQRSSVYWNEMPTEVRRCTWFFKDDDKLIPYDGVVSELLEREYSTMMRSGSVNARVDISHTDYVIFHSPAVLVQYTEIVLEPGWTGEDTDSRRRPKVVRRGVPAEYQMHIPPGEPVEADHLVLVVHGIGIYSDISYRSIIECVNDFRKISSNQIIAHGLATSGQSDGEAGGSPARAGRVEFLPIQWHACVHKERSVDQELEKLTLPSIKYMRNFVNDTLTDVLFFTSPVYCQPICDTVVSEMNRIYKLFKFRNPSYNGSVSLIGHSLGACILFDILNGQVDKSSASEEVYMHEDVGDVVDISSSSLQPGAQPPVNTSNARASPKGPLPNIAVLCQQMNLMNLLPVFQEEQIDTETIMMCSESDLKDLEIPFGPRKKLLAFIAEREYNSNNARASTSNSSQLGSTRGTQTPIPIGGSKAPLTQTQSEFLFEKTNSGIGQPLVNYAKLEFETSCLFCFGAPIGLFLSSRGVHSLGTSYKLPQCVEFLNIFHPHDPVAYRIEPLINTAIDIPPSLIPHHKGRKRIHLEIKENLSRAGAQIKSSIMDAVSRTWSSFSDFAKAHRNAESENAADGEESGEVTAQPLDSISSEGTLDSLEETEASLKEKSLDFGILNCGRRIDFVLQENPIESLNEYIFALRSHGCYWTSDDTALLVVDNIYKKGK